MDPCNLHEGEAEIVATRVTAELERARKRNERPSRSAAARKAERFEKLLNWPD
jgi:L-seryl-tRNA(Ser) seleniumtransferase